MEIQPCRWLTIRRRRPTSSSRTSRARCTGTALMTSGMLVKAAAPRKKDLRRLSEWLKLRKQASSNKPDDRIALRESGAGLRERLPSV